MYNQKLSNNIITYLVDQKVISEQVQKFFMLAPFEAHFKFYCLLSLLLLAGAIMAPVGANKNIIIRATTIFKMFRCSSSVLSSEPASDIIWLEELGPALMIQINQLRKLPLYLHQLSTLCSNENRGAVIIYPHMIIPWN